MSFHHPSLLLVFATALLTVCPLTSQALEWESTLIELKALAGDDETRREIQFRNNSDRPVAFVEIRPSCDCIAATPSTATLAPHASGTLTVRFQPGERLGLQEKAIDVTTDDAPGKPVKLVVRVRIAEVVSGRPRLVSWQVGDEPKAKEIELVAVDEFKLRSVSLPSSISHFTATVDPDPEGKRFLLRLTPKDTRRASTEILRLMVEVEGRHALPLTVYALVQDR